MRASWGIGVILLCILERLLCPANYPKRIPPCTELHRENDIVRVSDSKNVPDLPDYISKDMDPRGRRTTAFWDCL
jgi:hypothetical protein